MAKSEPTSSEREPGAPIPRDTIDPDLVKLQRTRAKIGIVTALGVVVLCLAFFLRLSPDRKFSGSTPGEKPEPVVLAEILAGNVGTDEFVEVEAEPLFSHAIRTVKTKGDLGARLVPVRGSSDRLWLALQGDAWDPPAIKNRYVGRLRKLSDVAFADAIRNYAAANPRPVFAPPPAIRGAFTTNSLKTVTGETVTIADGDRVVFELAEPTRALVVASLSSTRKEVKAWTAALTEAQLPILKSYPQTDLDTSLAQLRFEVGVAPTIASKKLVDLELWGVRVEAVTTRHETTWAALKKSPSVAFAVQTGAAIPDTQVDLVGVYSKRELPDDAYALLTSERPEDYWYVLPITILLVGIALMFAWALVRAVRRDLLPTRA